MGIIVANLFITLDGVYQGPGGREEDTAGGFAFGGWQAPVSDDSAEAAIEAEISQIDALLLGRKTYDIFASYWPHQSGDVGGTLNRVPKYVVSSALTLLAGRAQQSCRMPRQPAGCGRTTAGCTCSAAESSSARCSRQMCSTASTSGCTRSPWGRAIDSSTPGPSPPLFRLAEPARSFPKGAVSLVYEAAGDVETQDMPGTQSP